MYKVCISTQVEAFLRTLAPTPKQRVRAAIAALSTQRGDFKALENELIGFHRLKVGRHRIVFCYVEGKTIDCIFAEERKLVYEVFAALLRENLDA